MIYKCGIYVIEVISGNSEKIGIKYVGKSTDIKKRKSEHFRELRKKEHHSDKLQNYYNKYGINSLRFSILMECSENELNFWEKWWIKSFDSYKNGFNCNSGGEYSGVSNQKQCTLKNMVTGEVDTTDSMSEFARKHELPKTSIISMFGGLQNRVGNWYNPNGNWKPEYCSIIDPKGNKHIIIKNNKSWMKDFYRKHNLNVRSICSVLRGEKESTHLGWKREDSKATNPIGGNGIYIKIINDKGEIISSSNVRKLSKEIGITEYFLHKLRKGKVDNYNGWKLY